MIRRAQMPHRAGGLGWFGRSGRGCFRAALSQLQVAVAGSQVKMNSAVAHASGDLLLIAAGRHLERKISFEIVVLCGAGRH